MLRGNRGSTRAAAIEERGCSSGSSPFWECQPSPLPWLRQPSRRTRQTRFPLEGTWAIGDAQACDDPTSERLTFDASGTFTAEQGGEPTATGFWQLADDKLDLHMVSSPAFFDDQLQPFTGQYTYYYAQALLFDYEEQSFRMVAYMAGQLQGANLARCP